MPYIWGIRMNSTDELSLIQKRVLAFTKAFINNYGYPPTVREIAKGTNIKSTSTVHNALGILEQKGYINRDGGQSRSTVISGIIRESGVFSVPLLEIGGREANFGFIDVPKAFLDNREGVYAFKCPEDYEQFHILKGDILLVRSCENAEVGEITIGKDYKVFSYENDMEISGKVVSCLRHY